MLVPEYKCMEVSQSQKYVFLGGGKDDDTGIATLSAISFDTELSHAVSCQVGPEGMSCVYSMRRLKEGNVLFCGGYGSISVVFFDEEQKQFFPLANIENVMTGQISDLRFYEGSIHCISPGQEEMCKIRFPKYQFQIAATPRTRAKVSLATIFDLHVNNVYTLKEKASSIFLSDTGSLMYLGVEGFLKAASKDVSENGKFDIERLTPSHINYIAFKEVAQTYLAYSDRETNRFYLLDFNMKQIGRLQARGVQTLPDDLFLLKNYHSSGHDEGIFLWPMGDCKLAVIDVEN
jgi:hypothetical protein